MNATDASYAACAHVVAQEIYRLRSRRIGVLDVDDIEQELMISALHAMEKGDGRPGMGYVRVTVANTLKKLYANTSAAKRQMQDCHGRPVWFANPDVLAWQVAPGSDPEVAATARQKVEWLLGRLSPEDRDLVNGYLDGEIDLTPVDIGRIRYSGARR